MREKAEHRHIIEQVPVDYYQKGIDGNILQRLWHTNKLKVILELVPDFPHSLLDVGCASGWFISKLAEAFPSASCFGIDIYDKAIAHAKKLYPHIKFKVADAHRIPFEKETFDMVVCTEVLEHVDDPKSVLLEINRVLKKNGVAVIELDSGSWLFSLVWFLWKKFKGGVWKHAHLHSFDTQRLEQIVIACGFKILKKKKFNLGMAMAFLIKKVNIKNEI